MSLRSLALFAVALVVVGVVAVGAVIGTTFEDDEASGGTVAADSNGNGSGEADGSGGQMQVAESGSIADLVEEVGDSVVAIGTVSAQGGPPGQQPQQGIGSGVIIDEEGYVLTNFHVVQGASELAVQMADGTFVSGQVLGADPANDLAVVQIDVPPDDLVPASLGDSEQVRVGEPVFAIGAPFGLEFTVTHGIISGVDRTESLISPVARPILGALQTDAPINPGNSGGPLFNMNGEVIGINTAIENPSGQRVFVGIGLVVPINNATDSLEAMIAGETVRHPQLGIAGVTLNSQTAETVEVEAESGVYILQAAPGSAAAEGGIEGAAPMGGPGQLPTGGDVIVSFGGEEVQSMDDLRRLIEQYEPGETVPVEVIRDGDTVELEVTLDEWQDPSVQ